MIELSRRQGPPCLLVLVVLVSLTALLVQRALHHESPLAFGPEERSGRWVEVASGAPIPGVYQFSDALGVDSVIELTIGARPEDKTVLVGCSDPLEEGTLLEVRSGGEKVTQIQCTWMPASHRVTLGITLHPDRMTQRDWMFLPGIGEKLAARIENDRQKNGEFAHFKALQRVPGIGPKRLASWKEFF